MIAKFILRIENKLEILGEAFFIYCNLGVHLFVDDLLNKRTQLRANKKTLFPRSSTFIFSSSPRQMKSCEARPTQDKVSTIVYIRERAKV